MNITGIEKISNNAGDFIHVRFEIDNLIYYLTLYEYMNELVFIKRRQSAENETLTKNVTRLGISWSERSLTLDDFWCLHMASNSSLTPTELNFAFSMYCYLIDDNKTEQDFKLELTELLK